MSKLPAPFVLLATGIELLLLGLRSIPNLGSWVVEAITGLILTHILYLVSAWFVLAKSRTGTGLVLLAAIVFRLTLWTAFPALSDDVYRYRWEGKLQSAGGNPYQVRPQDPAWASLLDSAFANVGSRDFKAGYGPLTEEIQHWTYAAV